MLTPHRHTDADNEPCAGAANGARGGTAWCKRSRPPARNNECNPDCGALCSDMMEALKTGLCDMPAVYKGFRG